MASPPFNPAETVPQDTDIASTFPALERTFRAIIESWILFEHGRSGHHAFLIDTTVNRDADTTWEVGGLFFNSTTGTMQLCIAEDPEEWLDLSFPAATRMIFQQTAAPPGWTKVSDAAYNDAAFKLTTGTIATGGSTAFSSVFAARTISQANLPAVTLTSAAEATHTHVTKFNLVSVAAGGVSACFPAGAGAVSATSEAGSSHSHTVPLGGSGTALDFAVKYVSFILATKD